MAHLYSPISHICTLGAKLLDPNAKSVAEWFSGPLDTRTTASLSPPIATPHDVDCGIMGANNTDLHLPRN